MNLKLDLFERRFERNIVISKFAKLGKKYYDNGRVINLTQNSSNEWHAKIRGIEDYSVNVNLGKFEPSNCIEISKATCDCSFHGPHCIHKVAAYYAIYNYIFTNELSKSSVSESTLSELKDDIIVQETYWELRAIYLKLNDSLCNADLTKTLSSIRSSLTKAKEVAKKNPILAVRLLIVTCYELLEVKYFRDGDKFKERWYKCYYRTQEATSAILSEIQDEQIARCVTELLLNETLELQFSPESYNENHLYYTEDFIELYFEFLIELSPLAQSHEQIKQLLNEPRLLFPRAKERFLNKLLVSQDNG